MIDCRHGENCPYKDEEQGPAGSRLARNTFAMVLAGGRGSRLGPLTDWRAKPAVPFAGKFRIIDFTLSNCVNSGIRRIGVATQYKAQSLIRHVQRGWSFLDGRFNEFVELLPAQQRVTADWYRGTADAVYQNLDLLRAHAPEYVLVLAGDHVYKMDYARMLVGHVARKADMTIACIQVPVQDATGLGVMQVDEANRIIGFQEKPQHPQPMPGRPDVALGSMGIYVFNASFLYEQLIRDADISASSDAFWEANLDLTHVTPDLNLYDKKWPIWTHQEQLPPAKFVFDDETRRGEAIDALVSGGCIISGATVRRSLLFSKVHVHSFSLIEDSVLLGNNDIGRHCVIRRAVIDKGCNLAPGTRIGVDPEEDRRRFVVTEHGVTLVTPDMLGQPIHHLR